MQSVALLNGFHQRSKSPEYLRYQQYAISELTASVLHRFGGLNVFR
jgi:hypothetical protein